MSASHSDDDEHAGHERILPMSDASGQRDAPAHAAAAAAGASPTAAQRALGMAGVRQMQHAFSTMQPEDDRVTAESQSAGAQRDVCVLLRTLGYRPDVAQVSELFSALCARMAARASELGAPSTASSHSHDDELHLHSFIQLLRDAEQSAHDAAPYAAGGGGVDDASAGPPLDAELQALQRSCELMARAAEASSAELESVAPHLISVQSLRHRVRVAGAEGNSGRSKSSAPAMTSAELSSLLACAGVVDAAGMPAPHLRHDPQGGGYVDYRGLVRTLAANKVTQGV